GEGATTARDEPGGMIAAVSDTEIISSQVRLASSEGLFCEPASAAPLALLNRLVKEGRIEKDATIVVVLTGSGLKDPDAALKNVEPPIELEGDARTLAKVSTAWRWRSTSGWRSSPSPPTSRRGTTRVRARSTWPRIRTRFRR